MTKIITVQNADDEPTTQAEIVIQNKIDYIPKVSVIIPVYNVEQYLRECLDSVINQTLKEIEIICIDDGSLDSSLEILKEYAKKDNRITILKQQNLRAGIARNAGLSVAKGEYLSFLDSDDFFELNMHEEMYNKAKENDVDIVMCNADRYDNNTGKFIKKSSLNTNILKNIGQYVTISDLGENLFEIQNPTVWNNLYRRHFIIKYKIFFQNLSSCNDVAFNRCTLSVASQMYIINKVFVHYRINTQNSTTSYRGKNAINIVLAYLYIKKFLYSNKIDWLSVFLQKIIKSHINYEIKICSLSEFHIFKAQAKFLLKDEWNVFKNCFNKKRIKYYILGVFPIVTCKINGNITTIKILGKLFQINKYSDTSFHIKTFFGISLFSKKYLNK